MKDVLLFGVTVLMVLALQAGVLMLRWLDQHRLDRRRSCWRLHFPSELDAESVVQFLRTLVTLGGEWSPLAGRSSVVFEVVATADKIEHRLRLPTERGDFITGQLRAAIPAIAIEPLTDAPPIRLVSAGQWRLRGSDHGLRTDQPVGSVAAQLAALRPLGPGTLVVQQWTVVPSRPSSSAPVTSRRAKAPAGLSAMLNLLGGRSQGGASPKEQRDKVAEPLFNSVLRIGASASSPAAALSLVRRLAAVLRVVEQPGVHFVRRWLPGQVVASQLTVAHTPLSYFGCHLNARELAGVIAWPIGSPVVPGLVTGASRRLEPAHAVPTRGRTLGTSSLPGSSRSIAISAADSLHHTYVLGPTGVGKSTVLGNLALGDIAAGRSVIVVDPKGDLVRDIADRLPDGRVRDVILLDPVDDHPVGLNLLRHAHQAPERTADAVVAIFHRLYANSWGPRTGDVLHSALLTLAGVPGMTLCELPTLLTNDAFRRHLTARIDDDVLLGFWAWYDSLSPGDRAATLGPVMNKLRPLLLRRRLRTVIGQAEPAWELDDLLDRPGVLLVNLSRGELGSEAAVLLGSILVASLWQAVQRRRSRQPVMVLIDEFQDVVNLPTDLGEVLAQARGFGVGLTLAHQHLGQLSPSLRQAVLANARTKVVFQTAADDAVVLARQLGGGLLPTDLMRQDAHEAYLAPCVGGRVLPPCSLRTPPLPPAAGTFEAHMRVSRERYGQNRAAVETAMVARQRSNHPAPLSGNGARRRRRTG